MLYSHKWPVTNTPPPTPNNIDSKTFQSSQRVLLGSRVGSQMQRFES